jgi:hypothetical protein
VRELTQEIIGPGHKDIDDLLGARNPSVPVLILVDAAPAEISSHVRRGTRFLYAKDAILDLSSCRHGIAEPRP